MAQKVRVIPATISRTTSEPIASSAKRKVAAYARVSTDLEEQQTSYEAQVSYYTDYIKSREDWDFVKVYTDEGVTGTSTKYREGFQEMVGDALTGKIDLIVTKSVSRFARNTVDSLTTIRELKEHGTEVYFEKENIWTFDSKGELLLTIMSSLAQEESRSISENVRWGQRKKAADGKYTLAYAHFLGYDKGEDGKPVVNPEQAVIVQEIYSRFLEGYSFNRIAGMLTEEGIPSPAGKSRWNDCTIKSILTNEIYMGDKLLQKSFTLDFLHKKPIKNEGQVPQYYVENDHEAIIPETIFRRVQDEIKRREGGAPHGISIFSGKLLCGACGNPYGPKLWHSKDEYRRTVWQCNAKYKKKLHCRTPHLTEDEIKEAFLRACRKLAADRETTIAYLKEDAKDLADTTVLKEKAESLTEECARIAERLQTLIDKNARVAQDQKTYLEQYDELADAYKRTDKKLKAVNEEIRMKESKSRRIREFIDEFERMPSDVTEFDAGQWATFVDRVTVYGKDDIRFTLAYGGEIRA